MDKLVVSDTGTEYGMSRIEEIAYGCPRREWLRTMNRLDEEELDNKPVRWTTEALLTGSIGHTMLADYYAGGDPLSKDIVGPDYDPVLFETCLLKAQNTVSQYIALHPHDEFGQVLEIEKEIILKKNKLGIYPYSCRPDLVVRVGQKNRTDLLARRRVDIAPGKWLVDHKFVGAAKQTTVDKYVHSLQFISYLQAYNIANPRSQAQGVLANVVVKTKTIKVLTGIKYANTTSDAMILVKVIAKAKERGYPIEPETPALECNPGGKVCWSFGACRYFVNGECLRY